jgi:hypothetical protein
MKNAIILGTALLLSGTVAFAQTEETTTVQEHSFKSKNGHEVLPQRKDWALGISATGFLNYLGNMMNGNSFNNAPTFNSANVPSPFAIGNISGMAISGKYMRSATLAYRVRFQANAGRTSYKNLVLKDMPTPDPMNPVMVEDQLDIDAQVVLLSAGFEKRRGNGRLQGFYGAEAMVGYAGNNRTYSYGNGFSTDFTSPVSTTDFNSLLSGPTSFRPKEIYSGATMLAGLRGFIGVEYFVAPKISLGGELGYTLGMSVNGKGYTTNTTWNTGTNQTSTITTDRYASAGLRSMGIGVDNINAGINLHFYF